MIFALIVYSFVLALELSYLEKRERCCGNSFSQQLLKYQPTLIVVSCTVNTDKKHVWVTWQLDWFPVLNTQKGLQIATLSENFSSHKYTFVILHSEPLWNYFSANIGRMISWNFLIRIDYSSFLIYFMYLLWIGLFLFWKAYVDRSSLCNSI